MKNNVYVAYPYSSSQIVKYSSSGDELLKIELKIKRIKLNEEYKKFLNEKFKGYEITFPENKPFIKTINTDDKNNVWIATLEGDQKGESHFLVISEEGNFLGKAIIYTENQRNARRIKVKKENMYILFYSQEDDTKLTRYKILDRQNVLLKGNH